MLYEIPVERAQSALQEELGEPSVVSGSEVRWPGGSSRRRYVLYLASGKFLDTAAGRGTSVWTFLERRGWPRDRVREALLDRGMERDRSSWRGPGPGPRRVGRRRPPPDFEPARDNRDVSGWRRSWIERAWRSPPASSAAPARRWHGDPRTGDKAGAWPAGTRLPPSVRWIPAGPRDRRGNPGLAGFVAVPLHPLRAWRAMWAAGARRPAPETCLAVHLIALRRDGSTCVVRGWRSGDWKKLTIGAKRGCLWACGARAGAREDGGRVPRAIAVEGLADALTVASRAGPDTVTLSSMGVDIAAAGHAATHRWLGHRVDETLIILDGDEAGQAAARRMQGAVQRRGGRDVRVWRDKLGRDPYEAWGAPRRSAARGRPGPGGR